MKAKNLILGGAALLLAASATAQVKCKMPNGVTITKQLGGCPLDATAAYTLDGKALPKPSETAEGQRRLAEIEEKRLKTERARQDKNMAAMDAKLKEWQQEAREKRAKENEQKVQQRLDESERLHNICNTVLKNKFPRCEVETSIFRGNYIVVTTHVLPGTELASCKRLGQVAREHAGNGVVLSNNWSIRILSPYAVRPLAECEI